MKKIFGWILAVLSLVLLVVFTASLVLYFKGAEWGVEETFTGYCGMIAGISFLPIIGCGFAAHLLMEFAEVKGFPYYVTFPMYGIVMAFFYLVNGVKFIFLKLTGSNVTFDDVCLNLIPKPNGGSSSYGGANGGGDVVYEVTENGYTRTLTLFRAHCQDYECPDGEKFGAYYNKFKDDTGNYWRSYDGNKTFISERTLRNRGWKIS